jgi:hypothetical protein
MPPHCDTRDGPVVRAAQKALDTANLNYVLIWIPEHSELELRTVFEKALRARSAGKPAQDVADDWFFETAIRLHRAGEGESYTGMKPAGLDEGPVVPRAEKAIESGDPQEAIGFVVDAVKDELMRRFHLVMANKNYSVDDVAAGRAYVQSFIGFVVYSHHLYEYVLGEGKHGKMQDLAH